MPLGVVRVRFCPIEARGTKVLRTYAVTSPIKAKVVNNRVTAGRFIALVAFRAILTKGGVPMRRRGVTSSSSPVRGERELVSIYRALSALRRRALLAWARALLALMPTASLLLSAG